MKFDLIKNKVAIIFILLVGLLCKAPLLLIDLVVWDDVATWAARQQQEYHNFFESFRGQGKPQGFFIFYPFFSFENPILAIKLFNVAAIILSSLVVFAFCRAILKCSNLVSLVVSLLFIIYPAMQTDVLAIQYGATFGYFAFLLGCFLFMAGSTASSKFLRVLLNCVACLLWFISFGLPSLIFMYYGFLACIFLYYLYFERQYVYRVNFSCLLYILFLLLFPMIYYMTEKSLFPLHDLFAGGYNIPSFDVMFVIRNMKTSLFNAVLAPFANIIQQPKYVVLISVLLSFILSFAAMKWSQGESSNQLPYSNRKKFFFMILSSFVLLFSGILPYAMAGKPPGISGVTTRHAILAGLGVSLFLGGIFGLLFHGANRFLKAASVFAISFICIGFVTADIENFIDWQICSIKDKAIVEALKGIRPVPEGDFFIIRGDLVELEGIYDRRWYDWGYLFSKAWGGFGRFGIEEVRFHPKQYSDGTHPILGIGRERAAAIMRFMYFGRDIDKYLTKRIIIEAVDKNLSKNERYGLIEEYYCRRLGLCNESVEVWLRSLYIARVDDGYSEILSAKK